MYSSHHPETSGSSRRPASEFAPEFNREGARTLVERLASSEGVDLTPCEREPIHIPGAIQPHGAILALQPADFSLAAYSANAPALFGVEPTSLRHRPLAALIGDAVAAGIRESSDIGELEGSNPFRMTGPLPANGDMMDFAVHNHDGFIIVEAEPTTLSTLPAALPRTMVRLRDATSLDELGRLTVQSIRALSGFERVLIYRFDAEWNGEAIAEDKLPDLEPALLGLHFPEFGYPASGTGALCPEPQPLRPQSRRGTCPSPVVEHSRQQPAAGPDIRAASGTLSHPSGVSPEPQRQRLHVGVGDEAWPPVGAGDRTPS